MSRIRVTTCALYFTGEWENASLNQKVYDANKFIKAIKGKGINGYATIPVPDDFGKIRHQRLTEARKGKVFDWFAKITAPNIPDVYEEPCLLVPVPSSHCTSVDEVADGTPPMRLAKALASYVDDAIVEPLLWWDTEMPSAHAKQGSRRAVDLYKHLQSRSSKHKKRVVILVDDVMTTGGHIRACQAALMQRGLECDVAICAGRARAEIEDDPFELRENELQTYDPYSEIDWF